MSLPEYHPNQAQTWMRQALAAAREALTHNEVPVGCLIVDAQGREMARTHDARQGGADPLAHAEEARREYGIDLSPLDEFQDLDALVYAVNHARFQEAGLDRLVDCLNPKAVLVDVKSAFAGFHFPHGITYWSL